MKKSLVFVVFMLTALTIYSQEEWKPETHITGYVNTIAEFTDLQNWVDAKKNVGIGLSESAFLVSYKPLKNLEFKGKFVYTHFIKDIQSLLVEAYGTYTISEKLKLSAGKYLTPLSPVNQYFYAPLNPSATLPMVVSHHYLLPQSISGFQISGEFGDNLKVGYNVTYGHYMSTGHPEQGIIGIQGKEDYAVYLLESSDIPKQYLLGGSARIYGNYNDMLNIGLNYFDGRRSTKAIQEITATGAKSSFIPATKFSMGADVEFKLTGLKVNAEYWYGEQKTTDLPEQLKSSFNSYYGEIIYEAGIISPYVRYDYIEDVKSSVYMPFPTLKLFDGGFITTTYTAGIAIRPIYEILLKLEYRFIDTQRELSNVNIPLALQAKMPPDNPLGINVDKYNHFILSLVYSF